MRLLTRRTRRIPATEAGERLLRTVAPRFEEVGAELQAVTELRDRPSGTIRLTSTENAPATILLRALQRILPDHPEIKVEIAIDVGLTDIVAQRFDAGVRPGEIVASGMISMPIGPDMRMAMVGAPAYFANRKPLKTPRDLTEHNCINLHLPTHGGFHIWEFEKAGRETNVRVEGQLVFGASGLILSAARDGFGLAYLTEDQVRDDLQSGRLVRVLADWRLPFSGYHLYYPSRRQPTNALALLLEALRYRKPGRVTSKPA